MLSKLIKSKTMNCKEVNSKLIKYIDKELEANQLTQFEEHLSVCSECRMLAEEMSLVYSSIETEKNSFAPNPFMGEKIWAKIQSSQENQTETVTPIRRVSLAYIAAAGIFLGIALGTLFSNLIFTGANESTEQTWTQLADEYFPSDIYEPYEDLADTSK